MLSSRSMRTRLTRMRRSTPLVLLPAITMFGGLGGVSSASVASPTVPGDQSVKATQAVRHFYNERFQRCLDADTNTGGNGGKVQLWDCGPWNQQWWR